MFSYSEANVSMPTHKLSVRTVLRNDLLYCYICPAKEGQENGCVSTDSQTISTFIPLFQPYLVLDLGAGVAALLGSISLYSI